MKLFRTVVTKVVSNGGRCAAQSAGYLIYSEADFEVFRPAGGHTAPMGVKFGVEEWIEGPLHAKFHTHRCNDKGIGPPKLKFLVRFDQNVEWHIHCKIFYKICRICISFHDALAVIVLLALLKAFLIYGGFKLTGSGYPQIFSAPSGETMHQTRKVLEVQEHARGFLSPCQICCGSDFTRRRSCEKR